MDFSTLFAVDFCPAFFGNLLSIILIDLVLAGDNSVVIAMAVQSLPKERRMKGILFGSLAAVLLRVIFTFFAAQLLLTPFVKLIGGVLILWIAFKLMDSSNEQEHSQKNADTVWKAVWIILVADFTMSLDNVLAVAGASHGSLFLLLFGFGLSIPLVVFTSTLISNLMGKYPFIMWIGAAILGKVGGGMIVTDGVVVKYLLTPYNLIEVTNGVAHANYLLVIGVEILTTAAVVGISLFMRRRSLKDKSCEVIVDSLGEETA